MMNDTSETIARVLRRWWVVVLVTLVIASLGVWQVRSSPEQYRATMVLLVGPASGLEQSEALRVADMLRNPVTIGTYADILESPVVVADAMDRIDLPLDARSGYSLEVVSEPDSNVVRIRAEGPDPGITAQLPASLHAAGTDTLGAIFPLFSLTSLSGESVSAVSIKTTYTTIMPISLLVGIGVGVFAALWADVVLNARSESGNLYRALSGQRNRPESEQTDRPVSGSTGEVSRPRPEHT